MKKLKTSYEILKIPENLKIIEKAARVCYKTECNIEEGSDKKIIKNLISREHLAMLEFEDIVVKFISNRGFTHELVRHRIASFAQESTRYCNYSDEKFGEEITIAEPEYFSIEPLEKKYPGRRRVDLLAIILEWEEAMKDAEKHYFNLLELGITAQLARDVLPIGLKTEIIVKTNIREWRHILDLRALDKTGKAHPIMHELMIPLLKELKEKIPVVFDDLI